MPVKIPAATKQLALQKLRDGLSVKEVTDLTGVSARTIQTWKQRHTAKSGIPAGKTVQIPQAQATQTTATNAQEDKTTLDFAESPAPVDKKGVVDSALSSFKAMLGINEEKGTKAPPIVSAKLNAKQQQFVDAASPTLSLAAMALAAWLWGRIGPEYSELAPDEKVAERIVTPLLRVYARHSNFLTDINPDLADIGASMFALVGYVHVSLGLYQHIKREREEYEQGYEPQENVSGINRRTYRGGTTAESENGSRNTRDRRGDVPGPGGINGGIDGRNDGHLASVNLSALPDKEARQYEALSRLAQLDYQHRARRSGRSA